MSRLAVLCALLAAGPALPAHAGPAAPKAASAKTAPAKTAAKSATATRAGAGTIDPRKAREVRRLLELSGVPELGHILMTRLIDSFRHAMPKVPDAFWDKFETRANEQTFVNLVVPIYARHLSRSEIRALIRFYASPTGRRLMKVLPAITAESQAAGQKWARKTAQEILIELRAQGYQK